MVSRLESQVKGIARLGCDRCRCGCGSTEIGVLCVCVCVCFFFFFFFCGFLSLLKKSFSDCVPSLDLSVFLFDLELLFDGAVGFGQLGLYELKRE